MKDCFIEDNPGDSDHFWHRVDAALEQNQRVWVRTPLLKPLLEPLGVTHREEKWLQLKKPRVPRDSTLFRVRDVLFACLAFVCFFPLMVIVGIVVKLTSRGPIFYKTKVVVQKGRQVNWYKFRSMTVLPEKEDVEKRQRLFRDFVKRMHCHNSDKAPMKVIDAKRVTRFGQLMRKFSIDELPQIWNVLMGHISLVGPRPCLIYESEFFDGWRRRRFQVPQGLTGVFQVFGRGRASFEECAAMDVYYTYRRSFWFDLFIIYKTIGSVLRNHGAV